MLVFDDLIIPWTVKCLAMKPAKLTLPISEPESTPTNASSNQPLTNILKTIIEATR